MCFQGLIGLSVTQSQISRIMGKFPSSITCLNLSSNHLIEIDLDALSSVPHLGYLDLSNNNLTLLPTLEFKNAKAYFFLDVSGLFVIHFGVLGLIKGKSMSFDDFSICVVSRFWFGNVFSSQLVNITVIAKINSFVKQISWLNYLWCNSFIHKNVMTIFLNMSAVLYKLY